MIVTRMSADACSVLCALLRGSPDSAAHVPRGEIVAAAREHRVHLLLAGRLPGPDLTADLRDAAALDVAREVELRRVIGALASAGVRAVLIKGAALAQTHYPRPELRPRMDTDLMIPVEARERTARVLASLGYARPTETDGDLCVSQIHFERADAASVRHPLDVHWRISNVLAFADILSYDDLARDAVALPRLGAHALGPSTAHSLLLACLHRVAHHRDSPHLLWLYDIHLLANALDDRGRERLIAIAESRRVRAVCAASLQRAADAFGGRAGDLATRLAPPAGTTEPTAAFLGDRLRQVDVLTADIRALDGWSKRWQLVREHVFPAREYMFARYGTRRPLPWLYLQRIVLGAPKWFRS